MNKKIYIIITILFCSIFLGINKALALDNEIYIGDEILDSINNINNDKTAIYDSTNNILTLTSYNGSPIQYYNEDDLTILLEENNTITSDFYLEGIYSAEANIIFKGTGSLLIKNVSIGINIDSGNLEINNTNIDIQNIYEMGIRLFNGNMIINGKLSMNSDPDTMKTEFGYFAGYKAIQVRNDIKISGDLTIKNAESGITSNENITINSGNINIQAENNGIKSAKEFLIYGGNLDIELIDGEFSLMPKYGITATGKFNALGGKIHVLVPKNNIAIILNDEDSKEPEFNIANTSEILPNEYNIIETEIIENVHSKTLGLSINDIANEVTIQEKIKYTYEFIEKEITNYKLVIDGNHNLFKELIIDNLELIKDTDYIVTERSTNITFTEQGIEKLNTLQPGEYKVIIKYLNNKEVQGTIIINNNIDNPETGDKINSYIIIGVVSLVGLIIVLYYTKKHKK